MAEVEPPASSENPLAPILNATNLSTGLKGKAQRVFLRFLAGSLAHPYVRQVRENLDDMEGRSRINMMVAEELGRQAIADPEFMERARARLLGETIQKQENLESVLIAANQKIDESGGDDDAEIADNEPSQDWINSFTREAELASSDELRERLASILAGEIRAPGSVSRSTIRVIAEMEKTVLDQFQSALKTRCADAIFKTEDWTSGPMFAVGMSLENEFLVNGVLGSTYKEVVFDAKGTGFFAVPPHVLVIIGTPNARMKVKCWLLTKVGVEIADLLQPSSIVDQLRIAAQHIPKSGIKLILLGVIEKDPGGITPTEQLWSVVPESGDPD